MTTTDPVGLTKVVMVSYDELTMATLMAVMILAFAIPMWVSAIRTWDKVQHNISITKGAEPTGPALGVPVIGFLLTLLGWLLMLCGKGGAV